jgi:hypothetical protein
MDELWSRVLDILENYWRCGMMNRSENKHGMGASDFILVSNVIIFIYLSDGCLRGYFSFDIYILYKYCISNIV